MQTLHFEFASLNSQITTVRQHHSVVFGQRLKVSVVVVVVSVFHSSAVLDYWLVVIR